MRLRNADARGFSLIELMVAMAVTLIVTGAIYGLMTGGQNAFRREPAITDRQQNIRLAMDIIMRDIASAGGEHAGVHPDLHAGPEPCVGCPASPRGAATIANAGGARTDELEIMANPLGLDLEPACGYPGAPARRERRAHRGQATKVHAGRCRHGDPRGTAPGRCGPSRPSRQHNPDKPGGCVPSGTRTREGRLRSRQGDQGVQPGRRRLCWRREARRAPAAPAVTRRTPTPLPGNRLLLGRHAGRSRASCRPRSSASQSEQDLIGVREPRALVIWQHR